jgi:transcriptional regulator GlxA family with amidase domain
VCSGAIVLGATGLLDGRRVTTHWAAAADLAARHPSVTVEPDRIFLTDGNVWTSAGVTAGIDLALELVTVDFGADVALEVARQLVVFTHRPGGQSQFSTAARLPASDVECVRSVQRFVSANPERNCSAGALASIVGLSERHLQRVFKAETSVTLGRFVETVRVERARGLLESSRATVADVALRCGFGSEESLQRAFRRVVGTTAGDYRSHFRRVADRSGVRS